MECNKVKEQFKEVTYESCCESCHDDDDNGYGDDLWFEINGEDRNVCCAIGRSFTEWKNRGEQLNETNQYNSK